MNKINNNNQYNTHVNGVLSMSLPNELNDVIYTCYNQVKAPLPMILTCALSAMSASVHGFLDVKMPYGKSVPTSLYTIVIAKSGERKSGVTSWMFQAFRELNNEAAELFSDITKENKGKTATWKVRAKAKASELSKAYKNHLDEEMIQQLENEYAQIAADEPNILVRTTIIASDATTSALMQTLEKSRVLLLSSDEGQTVINNISSDALPKLNELWGGDPVDFKRTTGKKDIYLSDVRLCIALMVQPDYFESFAKKKKNNATRGSGFLARCLICHPESLQGMRFNEGTNSISGNKIQERFQEKLKLFINRSIFPDVDKISMEFSPEAITLWQQFKNEIESQLGPYGTLVDVDDVANKMGENVARMAAVIHFFCNENTTISAESLNTSIQIGFAYLLESKRLLGIKSEEEMRQLRMNSLIGYILGRIQKNNYFFPTITVREVLRNAGDMIKHREDFDMAMAELLRHSAACLTKNQFLKHEEIILNPNHELWRRPFNVI